MRAHLGTLQQLTEAEGRDFAALDISYKAPLYDTGIPSPDGSRRPFSGAPDEIAGDIRTFAAIGVHELIFDFRGQSIADSVERLQRFDTSELSVVAFCKLEGISVQFSRLFSPLDGGIMSDIDPRDLERIGREIRINELKHRVEEVSGEPLHT